VLGLPTDGREEFLHAGAHGQREIALRKQRQPSHNGIYYPCLEATRRRPYGLYVHGGMDTGGAVRAVEAIATGLPWRAVRPPVYVTGTPGQPDLEACWELGAVLAAEVAG